MTNIEKTELSERALAKIESLEPMEDNMVVHIHHNPFTRTKGGLHIPPPHKFQFDDKGRPATVLKIGPGRREEGQRIPMECKPGDTIIMNTFAANRFLSGFSSEYDDVALVAEQDVYAIVEEE